MGDIAFLLIIFFILAGIPNKQVAVSPPEAPGLGEIESAIHVIMDEDGKCYMQGDSDPVPVRALQGLIRERLTDRKSKLVVVEIDKSLPFETFKNVWPAVSEVGGKIGAKGVRTDR